MQIILTLLAIALLYVWVIVRSDTHRFVVREYDISSPKIHAPMTLCVLSDLHEQSFGSENSKLAEAILALNADAVLSAGDLITAHHDASKCDDQPVQSLLKRICGQVPVYLGMGNHERKVETLSGQYGDYFARYAADAKQAGAHVLRNEKPFAIAGDTDLAALDLDISYFGHGHRKTLSKGDPEAYCGKPDPSRFTILIAHEPSGFPVYADWGADLVLSGHVHGGIARLFGRGVINPAFRLFPYYDGGAFVRTAPSDGPACVIANGKRLRANRDGVVRHPDGQMIYLKEGAHAMIQSRGTGTHTIHVRFLNPCELVLVRLHPEREAGGDIQGK